MHLQIGRGLTGGILTLGQVCACGWWHKRQVHLWMRLTCFLFPHWGNGRMWHDTTLVKPSGKSLLVRDLTCGVGEHGIKWSWQVLFSSKRKQEASIYYPGNYLFSRRKPAAKPALRVGEAAGRKLFSCVVLLCRVITKVSAHVKRLYFASVFTATS